MRKTWDRGGQSGYEISTAPPVMSETQSFPWDIGMWRESRRLPPWYQPNSLWPFNLTPQKHEREATRESCLQYITLPLCPNFIKLLLYIWLNLLSLNFSPLRLQTCKISSKLADFFQSFKCGYANVSQPFSTNQRGQEVEVVHPWV